MDLVEDLYELLGFDKSHYTRWARKVMGEYVEGVHYTIVKTNF